MPEYTADLEKEVMRLLEEYGTVITDELTEITQKVAKETAEELKQTSPKNTGRYASGWTVQVEKKPMYTVATVYNAGGGQLTHLLEKGHPLPQGGRARAIPHIKPAEEKAVEGMERKVEAAIEAAMSKV